MKFSSGGSQLPPINLNSDQILTELCSHSWMLIPSISCASFFRLGVPPYKRKIQNFHAQCCLQLAMDDQMCTLQHS